MGGKPSSPGLAAHGCQGEGCLPRSLGEGGHCAILSAMWHAYIIRSSVFPSQRYIGLTDDLAARLSKHNEGGLPHTSKYRPWRVDVVVSFSDRERASEFERYLKSGSGFAFAKKHF
jgi:putative endonuclease